MPPLEVPAFGTAAAIQAVKLGASRVELNALGSYKDGGLTPQVEDLRQLVAAETQIPVRVMIRPRGPPRVGARSSAQSSERDFVYTDQELETMESSIKAFKDSGLLKFERGDGFVFGILKEENDVGAGSGGCKADVERCTRLIQASKPLQCVFHRAFDEIVSCDDESSSGVHTQAGLQDLAACGFTGILTSGGLGKAIDNVKALERIIAGSGVFQIEIIVGGGVRTANVGDLITQLGMRTLTTCSPPYFHSACLSPDGTEEISTEEIQGIISQSG
ncbi:hypothetical protein F5Y16DRAFT_399091 [Xylariaceae sp. FL0255]|nr:hypothetical protein F5Y16DRAFT_399091 [Xylariaceae sp. FL0255]